MNKELGIRNKILETGHRPSSFFFFLSSHKRGVTLVEILIGIGIFLLMLGVLWTLQHDFSASNTYLSDNLSAQEEARRVFKMMTAEMRSMSPSSTGGYPIEQVSTSSIVFYSDIDSNQQKERIRYYLDETTVRKGIVVPSGAPLSYNLGNETIRDVIHNVVNASTTPLFSFFDSTYGGTTTPLVEPGNILNVRLIRITVESDRDVLKPPGAISLKTEVAPRNLKDNL